MVLNGAPVSDLHVVALITRRGPWQKRGSNITDAPVCLNSHSGPTLASGTRTEQTRQELQEMQQLSAEGKSTPANPFS